MTTAIIGVGSIGSVLAANLVRGGEDVVLASRSLERARAVADETDARARAVPDAITTADVVILAVMFDVARDLVVRYGRALSGKIVVDPSNPLALDSDGRFAKTIPDDQSSGEILAALLPQDVHFAKAFGTQAAQTLADSSGQRPPATQFYAATDEAADTTVARLIRAGGYAPVLIGGIDQSLRIEVFGDLHEFTLGGTVTEDEAKKLI